MKAHITFYIGAFVAALSSIQFAVSFDPIRLIGVGVGLFFVLWGLKTGWIKNRNLTVILGHVAITLGCLVTAYALYQFPFLKKAPAFIEVIDMPLFWGLFVIWGGSCMITHGYCACTIKMHEINTKINFNGFSYKKDEKPGV
jgi:hypothetical protein